MKEIFFNIVIILKYCFIEVIIIFQLIQTIFNECTDRDNPFKLLDNTCTSKCSEAQINSGNCILDNNIIETQWLNNIIFIKEENFKYLNFIINSNGDLIYESYPFPCNSKRIFYGIKNNGRYYFKTGDNQEETPFFYLNAAQNNY